MKTKEPAAPPSKDNFQNIHKATVERRAIYDKELPHKDHVWFVWSFKYKKWVKNKKGQIFLEKNTRVGGVQIRADFVEEHGEANVKRMIIQNIVNKEKRV